MNLLQKDTADELSFVIGSNRELERASSDRSKLIRLLKRRGLLQAQEYSDQATDLDAVLQGLATRNGATENIPQNRYALRRQSARTINHFVTVISQVTVSEFHTLARILVPDSDLKAIEFQNNSHRQKIAILVDMQQKKQALRKVKNALIIMGRNDLVEQLNAIPQH